MEKMRGRTLFRVRKTGEVFKGVAIRDGQFVFPPIEDASEAEVWRLLDLALGRIHPHYIGFDGAKARFLHFFRQGFAGAGYCGEERAYKLDAKKKLDDALPLARAHSTSAAGEAALAAFRATNLLSPFEKMRVQDALRGPNAGAFVQAAARFAEGDIAGGLRDMAAACGPHGCAKWTVMTYLPFLWRPERHMFLKPEATKDFAARVGHSFQHVYAPQLNADVYESLLDLACATERAIGDLAPRDRIDIQSFIWVVGDYREGRESSFD